MEPLCQSSKANGCDEHGNPTPEKEQSVASEPKTNHQLLLRRAKSDIARHS